MQYFHLEKESGVKKNNYRIVIDRSGTITICPSLKKKSPEFCENAIFSSFVVEMRCKDGH